MSIAAAERQAPPVAFLDPETMESQWTDDLGIGSLATDGVLTLAELMALNPAETDSVIMADTPTTRAAAEDYWTRRADCPSTPLIFSIPAEVHRPTVPFITVEFQPAAVTKELRIEPETATQPIGKAASQELVRYIPSDSDAPEVTIPVQKREAVQIPVSKERRYTIDDAWYTFVKNNNVPKRIHSLDRRQIAWEMSALRETAVHLREEKGRVPFYRFIKRGEIQGGIDSSKFRLTILERNQRWIDRHPRVYDLWQDNLRHIQAKFEDRIFAEGLEDLQLGTDYGVDSSNHVWRLVAGQVAQQTSPRRILRNVRQRFADHTPEYRWAATLYDRTKIALDDLTPIHFN